jgi:CRISPR-associated protein Csb1
METITYKTLEDAVAGTAAGFRVITRLEPLGGPSDKLFPPTFGDSVRVPVPIGDDREDRRRTKYALEWRRVGGASKLCVVLDSVASQANRMELALLDGYERGELHFPFVRVDFTGEKHDDPALDLSTLCRDGFVTTLEAPHRLADALLRDSLRDGKPFRLSEEGKRFTEAAPSSAAAIFDLDPVSLIFGVWDSTALGVSRPGAKFERTITSEIVGIGAELGVKSRSRIDPAGIEKTEVYEAKDSEESWTIDPAQAKQKQGKPVLFKRGGETAGSPAVINHGNVKPSLDPEAGGVTVDYAEQTTVLSLPALRRLRFPQRANGKPFDGDSQRKAELAARTALAALALASFAYQRDNGYDLRSRCVLRPLGGLVLQLLPGGDGEFRDFALDREIAQRLLSEASSAAEAAGLPWRKQPIDLKPAPRLVALIRKSRELTVSEPIAEPVQQ